MAWGNLRDAFVLFQDAELGSQGFCACLVIGYFIVRAFLVQVLEDERTVFSGRRISCVRDSSPPQGGGREVILVLANALRRME